VNDNSTYDLEYVSNFKALGAMSASEDKYFLAREEELCMVMPLRCCTGLL
jgi:hypothetical protein